MVNSKDYLQFKNGAIYIIKTFGEIKNVKWYMKIDNSNGYLQWRWKLRRIKSNHKEI